MNATEPTNATFHGANASVLTYLTTEVVMVPTTASAHDAARAMAGASIGVVIIGTHDDVAALVSERDVVRAVAAGLDLDAVTAAEIGTDHLIWIDAGNTIGDAAEEMMEDFVRHVLVRGDEGLVGVLSIRDVLSAFIT